MVRVIGAGSLEQLLSQRERRRASPATRRPRKGRKAAHAFGTDPRRLAIGVESSSSIHIGSGVPSHAHPRRRCWRFYPVILVQWIVRKPCASALASCKPCSAPGAITVDVFICPPLTDWNLRFSRWQVNHARQQEIQTRCAPHEAERGPPQEKTRRQR